MTSTSLKNARVIDPANNVDGKGDVHIRQGVFTADAHPNTNEPTATINAEGLIVCPGLIDLYARLREPGFTRKGSIQSESQAAIHGGFTSVLCAPDTQPVIDSTATVELIRQRANLANGARVIPIAALSTELRGELLSELATLYAAGCPVASNADQPINDTGVLLSIMEYAASFDIPLLINPVDAQIAKNGCAHAGAIATRLGLPGIPVAAETVALARLIELCSSTGCRLHISRLSSARGVELVKQAKQSGLLITADVGIHHLFFTDQQLLGFDVQFHSAVPFRSLADREALRAAVADGTIDAICSDHAPHDDDAKLAPFPSSGAGLAAFDVFLPLLLALPDLLGIALSDVLAKVTSNAANIIAHRDVETPLNPTAMALPSGDLSISSSADIIVIDPDQPFKLCTETAHSQGLNSPLLGAASLATVSGEDIPLKGKVIHSFLAGRHVYGAEI